MSNNNKIVGIIISIIAILMSLFHMYTAYFGALEGMLQRSVHLMFALVLIFLSYPARKKSEKKLAISNWILAILSASSLIYIFLNYERITSRWQLVDEVFTMDVIFGSILIILILEATRRTLGLPLVIVAICFLLYGFFGQYMPGMFSHRGYTLERIVEQMYFTTQGIFGAALAASATFVFLYVLFGAFLENTKAGKFYMDVAFACTGRMRGGPAKAAVVASGMMGSISGSAIANVVTTGALTIPLMKKLGFRPHEAAAIESSASIGGQIMPPVMGASAFLIAEFTGVSYTDIVLISIIPALLYYGYVLLSVHFNACAKGIKGLDKDSVPKLIDVIKDGWHLTLPLIILVYLLIIGYTPIFAGLIGIISIVVVTNMRKHTRMTIQDLGRSLINGAKGILPIVAATACAGIVVGIISMTGLGMKFSSIIISLSGGNLFVALLFVGIAAIILGMGLPVIAAYVVLAVMGAPALAELGVPILVAHMVVMWFTQLSNITPPVCLTAFAGAAIAEADPFKTGFEALKFSLGMIILPFLFVYTPMLTWESIGSVVLVIVLTIFGFLAIASGFEGFLLTKINVWGRILLFLSGTMLLLPIYTFNIVGFILLIAIFIMQYKGMKLIIPKHLDTAS